MILRSGGRIKRLRKPDVDAVVAVGEIAVALENADYLRRDRFHVDNSADDVWIAIEVLLPVAVADDGYLVTVGEIVRRSEQTADLCAQPEHAEQTRADVGGLNALGGCSPVIVTGPRS